MEKKTYWRGVEGVEMLWHGEWADPELRYDNIVANCPTVEEELQYLASEEIDADDNCYEQKFTMWCQEHRTEVIDAIYMNQTAESRRYNFFDALDGDGICLHEPIVVNNLWIYQISMDEECRMWLCTLDDVWNELEQVSEYDHRRREFVRYYGGSSTEITLINGYAEQCYGVWLDE